MHSKNLVTIKSILLVPDMIILPVELTHLRRIFSKGQQNGLLSITFLKWNFRVPRTFFNFNRLPHPAVHSQRRFYSTI
jgi:hypothetical protein